MPVRISRSEGFVRRPRPGIIPVSFHMEGKDEGGVSAASPEAPHHPFHRPSSEVLTDADAVQGVQNEPCLADTTVAAPSVDAVPVLTEARLQTLIHI